MEVRGRGALTERCCVASNTDYFQAGKREVTGRLSKAGAGEYVRRKNQQPSGKRDSAGSTLASRRA